MKTKLLEKLRREAKDNYYISGYAVSTKIGNFFYSKRFLTMHEYMEQRQNDFVRDAIIEYVKRKKYGK